MVVSCGDSGERGWRAELDLGSGESLDDHHAPCPRKKFLSLTQNLFQPPSSSTSITVCQPYSSSPTKHTGPSPTLCHPSTLSKTHSHRTRPHRNAASFKSLYQKRPPHILEAP
jgi:hypothetical protein